VLGSVIASMSLDSKEVGLTDFARSERPPIAIPFFTFRIMVGCGLLMLLVAWGGTLLSLKERLLKRCALLWTVRNAGDFVLAIHGAVLAHDHSGGRAACKPHFHVLGRGIVRLSVNADLYGLQL
jgi:cytochrome bd-type quinol oxidase subunit 1